MLTSIVKLKDVSIETNCENFSISLSPIIVNDEVIFNKDLMKEGIGYPFSYKNNEYLAVKTSDKTIEIYKIKK